MITFHKIDIKVLIPEKVGLQVSREAFLGCNFRFDCTSVLVEPGKEVFDIGPSRLIMPPYILYPFTVVFMLYVNIEVSIFNHPQVKHHRLFHGCIIYKIGVLINVAISILVLVVWSYVELTKY